MKDFQDYLKSMVEEPSVEEPVVEEPSVEEAPNNQGNTEFDFMDHLKNALSKNTRKRIWGDW